MFTLAVTRLFVTWRLPTPARREQPNTVDQSTQLKQLCIGYIDPAKVSSAIPTEKQSGVSSKKTLENNTSFCRKQGPLSRPLDHQFEVFLEGLKILLVLDLLLENL